VRRHRACEVERHLLDRGAKKAFYIKILIFISAIAAETFMSNAG